MAEVTAGPKVIKEEDDMDTAAEGGPDDDEARQLLAEVSDAGSASGVRGGGLEDRTCPICKKVSKSATTLRMHLRNVHINAGSSYVCELCGVSYKLKASLEKHMKGVHQENRERDAICDGKFYIDCISGLYIHFVESAPQFAGSPRSATRSSRCTGRGCTTRRGSLTRRCTPVPTATTAITRRGSSTTT